MFRKSLMCLQPFSCVESEHTLIKLRPRMITISYPRKLFHSIDWTPIARDYYYRSIKLSRALPHYLESNYYYVIYGNMRVTASSVV